MGAAVSDDLPRDAEEMMRRIAEEARNGTEESLRNFVMGHLGTDVDATIEPLRNHLHELGLEENAFDNIAAEVVVMTKRVFPGGVSPEVPLVEGMRLMDLMHLGLMVHQHRDRLFPGVEWVLQ